MVRDNAVQLKVLYVDNDALFAQTSKNVLEAENNFQVELASSTKDAYQKLSEKRFDVIVSDFDLPNKDGLSFFEELVKNKNELPFILFTGKSREETAVKALNLGASGYVNKQGSPETVYAELAHYIVDGVEKRRQKRLAQTLLDTLPCVALLIRPNTREVVASNKAGIKAGVVPGKPCYSTWFARKSPCPWCLALKLWSTNRPQHLEVESQGVIWDAYWVPVEKDLYLHYAFDVTKERKKEKLLRESELKFRTVADYMYDWEYWTSPEAKLLFVSPSSKRLTGYSAEEFIENPKLLYEIVHPDDKPSLSSHFTVITKEPTHIRDFRIITRNGETRWLSHACQPVFDEKGRFLGRRISNRDITDRKNAEDALVASEKRWEATLASIGDSVIATDTDAKITFMNKTAKDATGWPIEEAVGKPLGEVFNIVNENTLRPVESPVKKVLEKGLIVGLANHTILVRKDGTTIPIDDSGAPIKDKNGDITGAVLVFRDISERKKAEEALEASEKRYRQLFSTMMELFQLFELVYDNNGRPVDYRLLEVNPAFERLVGKSRAELVGKRVVRDLWPVEQYWLDMFDEVLRTGKQKVYQNYGAAFGRYYELYIYKISDTQLASIALDITERKKAEEEVARYSEKLELLVEERSKQLEAAQHQLIKAERLAAIGELAGMIGHDLRNPLTGIKTSIYYLKKNNLEKMEPKSKEMIEVIEKCINHSNKIINDLLEYSKEVQLEPQNSTPAALISETISMLKAPLAVTIVNEVTSQTLLSVDFDKMKRVFSNLIKNSIEAMPNGGKITIACREGENSIEFRIADTGPGIPPQVMEKIFTPLVTTKAQGMGFGLAICKRIVEAHEGTITVDTGGNGTVFIVKVPAKNCKCTGEPERLGEA